MEECLDGHLGLWTDVRKKIWKNVFKILSDFLKIIYLYWSIVHLGRSLGGGHGNPLQYSCLEKPMDREAWWAAVHRVTQSRTQLKQLSTHSWFTVNSVLFQVNSKVIQLYVCVYIYILSQSLFHYQLLPYFECSSLCCTVGPCCVSVLYRIWCVYVNPRFLIYPFCRFAFGTHTFVFYVCESVSFIKFTY